MNVSLADFFQFYTRDQVFQQIWMTIVFILAAYGMLFVLIRVINRRVENLKARHTIRKNAVYLIHFLLFIAVVFVWLQRITSLSIFLGFASAGLALALQEVILSIAGWFLIIARHPFEVVTALNWRMLKAMSLISVCFRHPCLRSATGWTRIKAPAGS